MRKLIATLDNGNPRSDFNSVEQNLYYCKSKTFEGYRLVIESGTLCETTQRGWYCYGKASVVLSADEAKEAETILNSGEFVEWVGAGRNVYNPGLPKNTLEVFGRQARVR